MIPLVYKLRETVQLRPGSGGSWLVVGTVPLSVLRVNAVGARILQRARRGASVGELAAGLRVPEETVLAFCERLRRRGMLEVRRAAVEPASFPRVSVIVPTRDRASDLDECLAALSHLSYPPDKLEVIVVDDASRDPAAVRQVAEKQGARLLVNSCNRGPACSRNRAARLAAGEILAFVDSDCVADPGWLKELVPYFLWERVGAVGGRTLGYHAHSVLDRYEQVSSPLDMGRHLRLEGRGASTFYVPTCNLLVRTSLYRALGGLREDLRVGEDVDFCWRLRASGAYLLYAPEGVVRHKHRRRVAALLRQRAEYGRSEAILHRLHPEKRKSLAGEAGALATSLAVGLAVTRRDPRFLVPAVAALVGSTLRKRRHLSRAGVRLPAGQAAASVLRGHLSLLYFVSFHLVRYHLVALAVLGLAWRRAWALGGFAALVSGTTDYVARRPRLPYPAYLGLYLAEHLAYQLGVLAGCLQERTLRPYAITLARNS